MWTTQNAKPWAGVLACLAFAAAYPGGVYSQQEQDESQQEQDESSDRRDQNQSSQRDDSQSDRQDSQRERQDAQSDQQSSQRDQPTRQRSDRERWSDRESRQQQQIGRARSGRRWSDRDDFPAPREPWREDTYRSERRSTGWDSQQGNEAGLGVLLEQTGGESDREGIRVVRVHSGSPAEEMGVKPGDRITHLNGQRVQSARQFVSEIRDMRPGEEIELEVRRNNDERNLSGELESREEALVFRNRGMSNRGGQQWDGRYRDSGEYQSGTAYQGRAGYQGEIGRPTRSRSYEGDLVNQVNELQRQVDQLNREIDQLRSSIRDREGQAQQSRPYDSGETTASYQEFESRRIRGGGESAGRWDDREYRSDSGPRSGEYRPNYGGREPSDSGSVDTPGGEIGEERLHIGREEE